ncbi:MAG: hypothetical protein C4521_07850 [Actinobacteria bacterium]|nr:MAG: hypothetical protein C4521_07850 [Actinomycetota bacterium]
MEHRYRALRIIAWLYKILGIIIAIVTIIASMGICVSGIIGGAASTDSSLGLPSDFSSAGPLAGIFLGFGALIYGALIALGLYGFGELIMVMLAIEENTRGTYASLAGAPSMPSPAYAREVSPPPAQTPPAQTPPSEGV